MNNPPRLLIIDDEEMALMNLEHILKKQGYDIVTCDKGPKGLDLIKDGGYDVVLTYLII
jgi:ATP-dependent Lon protease